MESLAHLEALCERLYNSQDSTERAHAENTLKCFSVNSSYISQCQYILDNASTPYALMLASSSLLKQVSEQRLSLAIRFDIRNYLINYLATRGIDLETFVTASLIQLFCRVTKYGWFEDDIFREVVKESTSFLNQHCWNIIKTDVMDAMVEFQNNSEFERSLNASFIVSIPKWEGTTSMKNYRPISLVGSIYKILSKVLSIRLEKVLDETISTLRNAFMESRQILDATLGANEVVGSRIKQGVPALSRMMDKAVAVGCWTQLDYLGQIFTWFQVVSGLKINLKKCENFPVEEVNDIGSLARVLSCRVGVLPTTYLGVPLGRGRLSALVGATCAKRWTRIWITSFYIAGLPCDYGGICLDGFTLLGNAKNCERSDAKLEEREKVEKTKGWDMVLIALM
ncbi:hypothetical protein FXO38_04288 [Capsicum annuum]|nr:hypothetical protein FXO38_04288 [Capsicum annuum]